MKYLFLCVLTLLPLAGCAQKAAPEVCCEQEEADEAVAPAAPSAKEEAARFRGAWAVVKGEIEGERASDYEDGPGFVFGEGDFRWSMGLTIFGRYTLHPSLEPKGITLEWDNDGEGKAPQVVSMKGIYRHDGGRIEVCLNGGIGERPTTFEKAGKKGSQTVLLILERHKPQGNPPMKKDRPDAIRATPAP
jgi:uncharacterized protein (TIGR03067 family)